MFNDKKIKELEAKLCDKDKRIVELLKEAEEREKYIKSLEEDVEKLTAYNDNVPEGCKEYEWCQACSFVKYYRVWNRYNTGYKQYYYCGKREACKNFVEREDRNND